jgi:hypothetical protein
MMLLCAAGHEAARSRCSRNARAGKTLGRAAGPLESTGGALKDVTAIDEGNPGGPLVFGLQGSLAAQSLQAVRRKGDGPDGRR